MVVIMSKKIAGYLIVAAVFLLAAVPVHAAGNAQIVEVKQKEDQLLVWVRDAGSGSQVTATLGKTPVEDVTAQMFQESGMEMRTLILIDNSLSTANYQPAIRDALLEAAAARRENEYFALGTIGEHVTVLQDFTKDYVQLRDTLDAMEYQYQDTFITDALYDYLTEAPFEENENSFERILLISDGVDNKSLGYTKDELLGILKDTPLPIYSIGVQNSNENNDQDLENMFALSRAANSDSVLLSDLSGNADSLITMLNKDWNNLVVTAKIPESIQDGSLQTLTLRFGETGSTSLLDHIRMPLLIKQSQEIKQPQETEPETQPELKLPEPEPEPEATQTKAAVDTPVLIILVIALIVIIVLVVLLLKKKTDPSKPAGNEDKIPVKEKSATPTPPQSESHPEGGRSTVPVRGAAGSESASGVKRTRSVLRGGRQVCNITLKDIHDPNKIYQKTIGSSLIIGALPDSDICIDYDGTVSRKQCQIILENGALYLINHSNTNRTELNGIPVDQKTRLTSGSVIKMGLVEMSITFQL